MPGLYLALILLLSSVVSSQHTPGFLTYTVTSTRHTASSTTTGFITYTTDPIVLVPTTVTTTTHDNVTTATEYTFVPSTTSSMDSGPPVVGWVVTAFSPGTPIDGLRMEAAGHKFWLGGEPAAYCPLPARNAMACGVGNITTMNTCSMAVTVPGGQTIYSTSDGQIHYSVAHSIAWPYTTNQTASACPFVYNSTGGNYGELSPSPWAFGAHCLMACPTPEDSWQVFLGLRNATVPSGETADCFTFDAMTTNVTENGAWQYN